MSSRVKPLSRNQGFNLSQCAFILFSWDHSFSHLCFSSSLKVKTTMHGQTQDTQDACNSCVFLGHISSRKNEHPLNRSQNSTREKENEEK
jgi:hypothetical protein